MCHTKRWRFCCQSIASIAAKCLVALLVICSGGLRAQTCGIPGNQGLGGTLTGTPNTYYAGAGSVAALATSVSVGAINAAGSTTPIAAGDMVLIIQVQGADTSTSNNNQYGDGAGSGTTAPSDTYAGANYAGGFLNNANLLAGRYEYAIATSAVAAGAFSVAAPLQYSYATSNTLGTWRRFQVMRVPQYASLTIGAAGLTAAPWNGTSGGVVAIDVTGQLALAGGINATGRGFRGAGAREVTPQTTPATTGYRFALATDSGGGKAEGVTGTPYRTYSSSLGISAAGTEGYAAGDLGRGAPANAGGGANQHNCGGGGGGNGGAGGRGGACWNANLINTDGGIYGGHGGSPMVASATPTRLFMGGGGGAGDIGGNGWTSPQGSGGAGGGIIAVRAGSISGTGIFRANGEAGVTTIGTDGSGGGGAGGAILVTVQSGALPGGLTLQASGGGGGNADMNGAANEMDGPGGGGGGGTIYSSAAAVAAVGGGPAGQLLGTTSTSSGDGAIPGPYYARSGLDGIAGLVALPLDTLGTRAGAECLPNLVVSKSATTPQISLATGATAQYVVSLVNTGGGARNVSVLDQTLPPGWGITGVPTYLYSPAGPPAGGNLPAGAESVADGATFPLRTGPSAATAVPGSVPAANANSLTWSSFFLPQNGRLSITFTVTIPDAETVGTYHNPAGLRFSDPTRTSAVRFVTPAANDQANRTGTSYGATTYQTGPVSTVAGSNASGLEAGPATDDVTLLADLSVSKTHTPTTFIPGQTGTYTIAARNNGRGVAAVSFATDQGTASTGTSTIANPLQLTDNLPVGLSLNGIPVSSNANWSCSGVAGSTTFTCSMASTGYPLASASSLATITVPVLVSTAACASNPIINTASISVAAIGEGNTANNTASDAAARNCTANLGLTKSNSVTSVVSGQTTTYDITATNAGPASADGSRVADAPSAGLACTAVTCAASTGGAICPVSPDLTLPNLLGSGVLLRTFPSGSSVTLRLVCNVTATGS